MKEEIEYLQDEINIITSQKRIASLPKSFKKEEYRNRALKHINNEIRLLTNILAI